jgi:pantoate--beta-alanine ligase
MLRTLAGEPLARVDYAAVADPASFREVDVADGPVRLLLAAYVGETRLIDNLLLEP